jgi:hypothetical protein
MDMVMERSGMVEEEGETGVVEVTALPPRLAKMAEGIGPRSRARDIEEVIVALCAWKALSVRQISHYIGRSLVSSMRTVNNLRIEGSLEPVFPHALHRQKYRSVIQTNFDAFAVL